MSEEEAHQSTDDDDDPVDIRDRIEELRRLIRSEARLSVRTDDSFMLRYLRCSGYDPKAAFQRMKEYYSLKFHAPKWFADPENLHVLCEDAAKSYFYILPTRDRDGKSIYVNQLGFIKESVTSMSTQSQLHDLYTETLLDDDSNQRRGLCVIVDLKNLSFKLLKWLSPGNLKIAVKKSEALPVRTISYHVVNPSPVLNVALKIILPLLNQATKENIHIHDRSWSSLHKMVPPESLPIEYGGVLNPQSIMLKVDTTSARLLGNLRMGYTTNPGFHPLKA